MSKDSSSESWIEVASAKSADWSLVDGASSCRSWSSHTKGKEDYAAFDLSRLDLFSLASKEEDASKEEVEDAESEDPHADEYTWRKTSRQGKKAIGHSLVRRDPHCIFQQDHIEVSRPGARQPFWARQRYAQCPKSVVDDALPELLHSGDRSSSTTLGRSKLWEDIPALLEHLAATGKATRVLCTPSQALQLNGCYAAPFGRYSDPPMQALVYSVPANGYHIPPTSSKKDDNLCHELGNTAAVYSWQRGRCKVLYELASQPPPGVCNGRVCQPLKGKLKAVRGTKALDGCSRKAFTPGVAAICGSGAHSLNARSLANAVVEEAVDLVFNRPVIVQYASVAGKIHDSHQQWISLARKDNKARYYQSEVVSAKKTRRRRGPGVTIHVAKEGTEAYCDRVEISARLRDSAREWVRIGEFGACRNGHDEKAIRLGRLSCIALRFRAVSWRGAKPLLRVGAYGEPERGEGKEGNATSASALRDDALDDSILYTLNRLDVEKEATQRRYGLKSVPFSDRWTRKEQRNKKKSNRRELKQFVCDVLADRF